MSATDTLKAVEVGALLLAGGLFVWWQLRDVSREQRKRKIDSDDLLGKRGGDAMPAPAPASASSAQAGRAP